MSCCSSAFERPPLFSGGALPSTTCAIWENRTTNHIDALWSVPCPAASAYTVYSRLGGAWKSCENKHRTVTFDFGPLSGCNQTISRSYEWSRERRGRGYISKLPPPIFSDAQYSFHNASLCDPNPAADFSRFLQKKKPTQNRTLQPHTEKALYGWMILVGLWLYLLLRWLVNISGWRLCKLHVPLLLLLFMSTWSVSL